MSSSTSSCSQPEFNSWKTEFTNRLSTGLTTFPDTIDWELSKTDYQTQNLSKIKGLVSSLFGATAFRENMSKVISKVIRSTDAEASKDPERRKILDQLKTKQDLYRFVGERINKIRDDIFSPIQVGIAQQGDFLTGNEKEKLMGSLKSYLNLSLLKSLGVTTERTGEIPAVHINRATHLVDKWALELSEMLLEEYNKIPEQIVSGELEKQSDETKKRLKYAAAEVLDNIQFRQALTVFFAEVVKETSASLTEPTKETFFTGMKTGISKSSKKIISLIQDFTKSEEFSEKDSVILDLFSSRVKGLIDLTMVSFNRKIDFSLMNRASAIGLLKTCSTLLYNNYQYDYPSEKRTAENLALLKRGFELFFSHPLAIGSVEKYLAANRTGQKGTFSIDLIKALNLEVAPKIYCDPAFIRCAGGEENVAFITYVNCAAEESLANLLKGTGNTQFQVQEKKEEEKKE